MASLAPHTEILNRRQVAHLLRRSTFGATKQDIDSLTGRRADQILNTLFLGDAAVPLPPVDPMTGSTWVTNGPSDLNSEEFALFSFFLAWWMNQMHTSGLRIKEKLTFFLHSHFTTSQSVVGRSTALYYQNALFRHYALGDFKELTLKVCLDNAMMMYLDNDQNVKGSPNENFARELLELYTIGKGVVASEGDYTTFTEQDVREAARVLSGYQLDADFENDDQLTGYPQAFLRSNALGLATHHDAEGKIFSQRFQSQTIIPASTSEGLATIESAQQELQDLIDMVFNQEATAKYICRKLYRYFVYYRINDEIENDIIAPLAQTFRSSDFSIESTIRQLLQSQHFFDLDNVEISDNIIGGLIKSPLENSLSALRYFETNFPNPDNNLVPFYESMASLRWALRDQGLPLYQPFEVAGYPAYHQAPGYNRNWISSNSLAQRYYFTGALVWGQWIPDVKIDVLAWVENNISDPRDAEEIVTSILQDLLPESLTVERYGYFLNTILLDGLSLTNWSTEWGDYLSSQDETNVRGQLEVLLVAILQSPEFQLQ